jgi:DNA-3-methyladenine glycosylase II
VAQRLKFSAAAAYRHLRKADPVLAELIEECGPYTPRAVDDPLRQLLRSILYQQLAGNAARAIERRWLASYGIGQDERYPTPAEILASPDEQFRSAGVSRQKASYLRSIAEHVSNGSLDLGGADRLDDATVEEQLTAIHGVGEWTAHMFLMFALGRPDVLPVGDLGVRKGMETAYRLPSTPTPSEARTIGEPWAPYRSVGSWYMWRAVETVTPD